MGMIEFDFAKAEKQADELEQLSNQMQTLIHSRYMDAMQTLSMSWKGTAADTYMKKASIQQQKIEQTAKELKQTAESLRAAARLVKIAEERAKELAQRRMTEA